MEATLTKRTLTTVEFDFMGTTYHVVHHEGNVMEVYKKVAVKQAMQPHVRRRRVRGDLFYAINRAFRAQHGEG